MNTNLDQENKESYNNKPFHIFIYVNLCGASNANSRKQVLSVVNVMQNTIKRSN